MVVLGVVGCGVGREVTGELDATETVVGEVGVMNELGGIDDLEIFIPVKKK